MPLRKIKNLSIETRRLIQTSVASDAQLARDHDCSRGTIRRWRGRGDLDDRSHAQKRRVRALTDGELQVVRHLRSWLKPSIDDLAVMCESLMQRRVSKATLNRFLQQITEPPLETRRRELGSMTLMPHPGRVSVTAVHAVANDRTTAFTVLLAADPKTLWLHSAVVAELSDGAVFDFLRGVIKAAPFRVCDIEPWCEGARPNAAIVKNGAESQVSMEVVLVWASSIVQACSHSTAEPWRAGGVSRLGAESSLVRAATRHNTLIPMRVQDEPKYGMLRGTVNPGSAPCQDRDLWTKWWSSTPKV